MSSKASHVRELTPNEWILVAGGDITVDGGILVSGNGSYQDDNESMWAHWWNQYFDPYENDSSNDSGYGEAVVEVDPALLQATETASKVIEAQLAVYKDIMNKYGPNYVVEIKNANGQVMSTAKVADLVDGLGRLAGHVNNFALVAQIANGDKNLHDAVHAVFGVTVSAMVASAGSGAALSLAAGFGAETASSKILDWMEKLGDANDHLRDIINAQMAKWVQENAPPGVAEADVTEAIDILRGMMGWQVNPYEQYQ